MFNFTNFLYGHSQHVETKSNPYYQNQHKNNHKNNAIHSNNEQDIISLQYQIIEDKAYDKLITAIK